MFLLLNPIWKFLCSIDFNLTKHLIELIDRILTMFLYFDCCPIKPLKTIKQFILISASAVRWFKVMKAIGWFLTHPTLWYTVRFNFQFPRYPFIRTTIEILFSIDLSLQFLYFCIITKQISTYRFFFSFQTNYLTHLSITTRTYKRR